MSSESLASMELSSAYTLSVASSESARTRTTAITPTPASFCIANTVNVADGTPKRLPSADAMRSRKAESTVGLRFRNSMRAFTTGTLTVYWRRPTHTAACTPQPSSSAAMAASVSVMAASPVGSNSAALCVAWSTRPTKQQPSDALMSFSAAVQPGLLGHDDVTSCGMKPMSQPHVSNAVCICELPGPSVSTDSASVSSPQRSPRSLRAQPKLNALSNVRCTAPRISGSKYDRTRSSTMGTTMRPHGVHVCSHSTELMSAVNSASYES
mmetsp:Transcript_56679/g.136961  ORF Transcript_56679/g.136961 Transcript_56679/m.136961 type:complete len:268 (+) Transcript_56679:1865-2668(+)